MLIREMLKNPAGNKIDRNYPQQEKFQSFCYMDLKETKKNQNKIILMYKEFESS